MNSAQPILDFKDHIKLAKYLTRQVMRRYAGVRLEFDDVFGEVALIWVRCRDGFDPEFGVQFTTYFTRAVHKSASNIVRHLRDPALASAARLDQPIFTDEDGEDGSMQIADIGALSPERGAIISEALITINKSSPLLTRLLALCRDQPAELIQELHAAQAHRDYAARRGHFVEEPASALTPRVLGQIFKFNWRWRDEMIRAIDKGAKYVA